ncbi:MAG: trehalase family glycosidase [Dysgonamonadaceae bacterium]|jgi:putative isomerase
MMTNNRFFYFLLFQLSLFSIFLGNAKNDILHEYSNILNISYTPDLSSRHIQGCFVDMGSWMGFSIPQKNKWINGFCGPFSISEYHWLAKSAVKVTFNAERDAFFIPDSINYYPGGIYIAASSSYGTLKQTLIFIDSYTALLHVYPNDVSDLFFTGDGWRDGTEFTVSGRKVVVSSSSNEKYLISFPENTTIQSVKNNYEAVCKHVSCDGIYIVISQIFNEDNRNSDILGKVDSLLVNPKYYVQQNAERWNAYIQSVLRKDLKPEYNRIAVKSIVTLVSNWRTAKGALLHDGVVPSHAVPYFIGFWAWDSWKHAAALVRFNPELAKNQIRSMFDYQMEDGMIIDCIYVNPDENNCRNSKPPLAAWAVNEVYEKTKDLDFLREMYPKLLKYHMWWFQKRDHDKNGICEFGSVDGTLEAAAWESGMDNAIRFDNASIVKNDSNAWSMDQESVDLNCYLVLERDLLQKFSNILGESSVEKINREQIANYFFDEISGFFYDKKLSDHSFIKEQGCEAYSAFWTRTATQEQFNKALPVLKDKNKFSTFIPFPTAAADNPKFNPQGYWRGSIWLDQVYFAIKGIRNYGVSELADEYTKQIFDRLYGLINSDPIYENYDPYTGNGLQAPHFSWSASHLLLLYDDLTVDN